WMGAVVPELPCLGGKGAFFRSIQEPRTERPLPSLQRGQHFFDFVEVGQVLRRWGLLAVTDGALLVDDKGGPSCGVTHSRQHGKEHLIFSDNLLVQVAGKGDFDILLLSPSLLGEGRIDADADDIGIESRVGVETACDVAHLLSADASEGGGEEKKK